MLYHLFALLGVGFHKFGPDFCEIILSVVDLFLFGIVFERGVGFCMAFGMFLHFTVSLDFVAFPEIAHGFDTSHELLSFVKIVGL